MSRYLLRITAAILSFSIGIFGVWASGYLKSFEDFVVERLSKEETVIKFEPINVDYVITLPLPYEKEEQAVYQATFQELFGSSGLDSLFVMETTNTCRSCNEESPLEGDKFGAKTEWFKAVQSETYQDYLSRNKAIYKIDRLPNLPFRSYLRRVESLPSLPQEEDYRALVEEEIKFYEEHPNSRVVCVSRVGFNQKSTQAFIFVRVKYNIITFTGKYFLLKKVGGVWKVKSEIELYHWCAG